ncbi:class I SAM-dependent methyltransferase [Actinomadura geliboluensis]|uniref:class I SAM-dependent methyltransferase n=1 Tax=Actinomadura geliboluensis TaxID=882440 RepID=UPI00371C8F3F
MTAARLLPHGCAVGIDLRHADQSGSSPDATRRNAELEGVADRTEVETGDMTRLPFADETFDLVISKWAVHNTRPRKDVRPPSTKPRASSAPAADSPSPTCGTRTGTAPACTTSA